MSKVYDEYLNDHVSSVRRAAYWMRKHIGILR